MSSSNGRGARNALPSMVAHELVWADQRWARGGLLLPVGRAVLSGRCCSAAVAEEGDRQTPSSPAPSVGSKELLVEGLGARCLCLRVRGLVAARRASCRCCRCET